MDPARATISSLENLLVGERRKYEDLLARVQKFAPHLLRGRTLPAEITSTVLHLALLPFLTPLARLQEKYRLRLVCREWNKIIVSHRLFSKDVVLNVRVQEQWKKAIEETNRRVLADDTFLFDLHLHMEYFSEAEADIDIPREVIQFISLNAGKIESLHYKAYGAGFKEGGWWIDMPQLLQLFPPSQYQHTDAPEEHTEVLKSCRWDSLKTLRVGYGAAPEDIFVAPNNYPALRTVHFAGISHLIPDFVSSWSFPWDQLTSITITNHFDPMEDYLSLLALCPSLEHFHVEVDWKNDTYTSEKPSTDTDRTFAKRLKSLHLGFTDEPILDEFLCHIHAQSLESIHISWSPRGRLGAPAQGNGSTEAEVTAEDVIESTTNLVKKSKCKLRNAHLELMKEEQPTEEESKRLERAFTQLFDSTPKLESFSLTKTDLECFPFDRLPCDLQLLNLKLLNRFSSDTKRQFEKIRRELSERPSAQSKELVVTIEAESTIAEPKETIVV
ncbi:hypothetical protein MD484_g5564, partial [Candolleomyces efflorescens]